jgi:hypothetical protein
MLNPESKAILQKMKNLADVPMKSEQETKRVEIIMLKFKEEKEVIDNAVSRIIHNTNWPFKLTIYDNRPNTPNTSRIWNKLVKEATCDYIMLIDSDAFVPKCEPCWLTRMMESIDDTGLVIPVSSTGGGAHQHVNGPEVYPSVTRNKDIWSGYCFLFKKETYEKVGPFDEQFYIYGQDSEWAHRAKKIGGAAMRKDTFVEHIGSYSFSKDPLREDDKFYAGELFKFKTR